MHAISAIVVAFAALATALPASTPTNGTLGLGLNATSVGTVFNVSATSLTPLAAAAAAAAATNASVVSPAAAPAAGMALAKRQLIGLPVGLRPVTPGLLNSAARRTERDVRRLANDVRRTQVDAVRLRNDQLRLASFGAGGVGVGGVGVGGVGLGGVGLGLPGVGVGLPLGGVAGVPVPVPVPVPVRAAAPVLGLNVATPLLSTGVSVL